MIGYIKFVISVRYSYFVGITRWNNLSWHNQELVWVDIILMFHHLDYHTSTRYELGSWMLFEPLGGFSLPCSPLFNSSNPTFFFQISKVTNTKGILCLHSFEEVVCSCLDIVVQFVQEFFMNNKITTWNWDLQNASQEEGGPKGTCHQVTNIEVDFEMEGGCCWLKLSFGNSYSACQASLNSLWIVCASCVLNHSIFLCMFLNYDSKQTFEQ